MPIEAAKDDQGEEQHDDDHRQHGPQIPFEHQIEKKVAGLCHLDMRRIEIAFHHLFDLAMQQKSGYSGHTRYGQDVEQDELPLELLFDKEAAAIKGDVMGRQRWFWRFSKDHYFL